ncbi:MAG: efflux RND transporter periplasmic adaptor subunit [Cyclobacteriaceae bacterium]|nr:efflux RND transporter periplasmic adaptor subunit [Cyclobacteriaceae bacterium]
MKNLTINYMLFYKHLVGRNLIAATAIILMFALEGCSTKPSPEADVPAQENTVTLSPEKFKAAGIETGELTNRVLSSTIKVNGMLDVPPQNLVTISAPMGGFVKQTHLLQGMHIRKGEALVELEHQDYIQLQQDYLERESQLTYLEAEYTRQQELAKENVNAQKTLQQAKSQYESMKANVSGLEAKLAMMRISPERLKQQGIQPTVKLYSPINGFVTEVNVNLGKFVNPTDVLFKIVDPSHLHAELYVFEKDLPQLSIGQRVHFSLANESRERVASIHLIGKEISAERTVRIHCHLEHDYPDLIPGMYLKAWIETDSTAVLVLPNESILNFEGTTYVFTTEDKKTFRLHEVKTGISEGDFTQILPTEGLNERSVFVIKGAYELLSLLKNTEE